MNFAPVILSILALAALTGAWRTARTRQRGQWLRIAGQFVMAGGLALIVLPPSVMRSRETLLVLTPGADAATVMQRHPGKPAVALRGVGLGAADIETVADLATALRRHPLTGTLRVFGDGLPARDREAAQAMNLAFEPGEPLVGIVGLAIPAPIHAGRSWTLRGQVAGVADARMELRDRSDRIVASVPVDADGRFALTARTKIEGQADYRLRLSRDDGAIVEELPLVLNVLRGDSVRVLIVAGTADAELKYLRRWLVDSGSRVSSRIALSRGIEQRQDARAATPGQLAESDLLLIDERAWASLPASERSAITQAVERGLGLLLRVTGPVSAKVAAEWAELGMALELADQARSVRLADLSDTSAVTHLTRLPMRIVAAQSASLQQAHDGSDLGRWRARGQGRLGVWLALDSYRLVLAGESARFESLWADVLETLARARGVPMPEVPPWMRAGQRALICDLAEDARIEDAQGVSQRLLVESDGRGCAAWWPASPGSYALVDARGRWPVHVGDADRSRTLWRAETRRETQRLERSDAALPELKAALPRWLVFLIWLPVTASFWWLERRRSAGG